MTRRSASTRACSRIPTSRRGATRASAWVLARERKGQLAQARLEYTTYLAEFPDGPDAERVQQRLAGTALTASPVGVARDRERAARRRCGRFAAVWRSTCGIPSSSCSARTARSTRHLASNLNLVVRRHGERFDMLQRFDAAYHYNLLDATESSDPDDQLHVTNAYVDLTDGKHDWQARVGRQSRFGSGIVGRFDGAHVGLPVAPRHRTELGTRLSRRSSAQGPRHPPPVRRLERRSRSARGAVGLQFLRHFAERRRHRRSRGRSAPKRATAAIAGTSSARSMRTCRTRN